MTPLKRAIVILGRDGIAAATGVTAPESVSRWNKVGVPAKHCRAIEGATNGKVSVHDLRPDVFGPNPNKNSIQDSS